MSRDTPTETKDAETRGLYANHAGDPSVASYLSSLLFLLSVPACIGVAYAGFHFGLYPYSWLLAVFGVLMFGIVAVAFTVMHLMTGH